MKDITRDKIIGFAIIAAVLVLSLLARIQLLPLESGDYHHFLSVWMDRIKETGPWASLGLQISDYSSLYMYIMCLVSGFGNSMFALKAVSILFDYAAAAVIFYMVVQLTSSKRKGIAAMAAVLLCPTVMINSAWWCQCDIIYITFMLLCLLFLFKDKSAPAFIMLGIAFAFKLQAVFLLPFIVILWLKGKTVKLWHLLWIPAVFFISVVPAWIAGRPLTDLLGVYFSQAGSYPFGTLHYPNMYEFLHESNLYWHHMQEVGGFGLYFSMGLLGAFIYWVYYKKFRMTNQIMVSLALFSVCLVLFTLPHMHERYGLIVDILAIVYAVQRPEKTPVALGLIIISLLSYMPYLNSVDVVPGLYLSFAMLAMNIMIGKDLVKQINENRISE